ncbi:hypothetical protein [Microbacterium sp. A93]|uniref:hypothetical protein n=1 Tax=Microbacterium sp. A93 TaxID=3450716 RepID=UPI003F422F6B
MRLQSMLQTTAVLGVAVVAGLLAVTGTWALWSSSAPSAAGAVQAADFHLELDGKSTTSGTIPLTPPGEPLTPNQPVYSSFSITNATNASGDFRVRVQLGTPVVRSDDTGQEALAEHVIVKTIVMPASGHCAATPYGDEPATTVVDKNHSTWFCVQHSLPADAPAGLSNSQATVDLSVTATQIPPASTSGARHDHTS